VTSLLGCLRSLYGERTQEYYIEPPKNWWTLRGTLLHQILTNPDFEAQINDMRRYVYRLFKNGSADREALEKRWVNVEASLYDLAKDLPPVRIPDWESEVEYQLPLGIIHGRERFLKGTVDVIRRSRGEILDYKTIGDKGLAFIKQGAKPDHIKQFNLYRLLEERGRPVGHEGPYEPVKITKIKAFYMAMMGVWGTGTLMDETTMYLKSEPEAQPSEVGRAWFSTKTDLVLKKGKRKDTAQPTDYEQSIKNRWKITYAIPEVPLLDLDELYEFAKQRAAILVDAFDNGTMPPMCGPEMRAWKCENYCNVRDWCDAYNETVGEKRVVDVSEGIPVEVI